jgi:hypothetical protein
VAELTSLLPAFLILVYILLQLLHMGVEVLADFHFPKVLSLLLLLPLPGHFFFLIFVFALDELAGL